jgi:hypothetical protein
MKLGGEELLHRASPPIANAFLFKNGKDVIHGLGS